MASGKDDVPKLPHKLVHLDMKGAPPTLSYLEKVFPIMKSWGATGLLVEYEDTFPYTEHLKLLQHKGLAYSPEEIQTLQMLAAENDLIVIPLVQTFGHMEFVLKHAQFEGLREVHNFPMALCPSNPESLTLVCTMVDMVMNAHDNLRWFHIGCDEVYHLGVCERCRERMLTDKMTTEQLFFQHAKNIAQHIRDNYPSITPIVWDDMFRFSDIETLKGSGLGEMVEPMVWHYVTTFQLPADLWEKLSAVFPHIWVASAFKGATGSRACVTSVAYHLENHVAWLNKLGEEQHRFAGIRGIALTGWQRYDHYAVLCELLPQAFPSLGICLRVLEKGSYSAGLHKSISDDLKFSSLLPLNPFTCTEIPHCSFPGSQVYQLMIEYAFLESYTDKFVNSDACLTWLNDYNVGKGFINPVHVEPINTAAKAKLQQLEQFEARASATMSGMLHPISITEWICSHLWPIMEKLRHLEQKSTRLLSYGLLGDTALWESNNEWEAKRKQQADGDGVDSSTNAAQDEDNIMDGVGSVEEEEKVSLEEEEDKHSFGFAEEVEEVDIDDS